MYGQMTAVHGLHRDPGIYKAPMKRSRKQPALTLARRVFSWQGSTHSRPRRNGGAQPLAVTMLGGVCLAIEIDPKHAKKRLETNILIFILIT